MKYKLCSLLLLTAFSGVVQAGVVGANIDSTLDKCKKNAISTIDSQNCYNTATSAWDSELNKQYKELIKDQPESVRTALQNTQRLWIKYRDSYAETMNQYYKQQEGTTWGLVSQESKMSITRDKAIDLYRLRNSTNVSITNSTNIIKKDANAQIEPEINNDINHESGNKKIAGNTAVIPASDAPLTKGEFTCKFVMEGDKSIQENGLVINTARMHVKDNGKQFTVTTGDYYNIPKKMASPNLDTSLRKENELIGTGGLENDGSVTAYKKYKNGNYVLKNFSDTSFNHIRFIITLFACK